MIQDIKERPQFALLLRTSTSFSPYLPTDGWTGMRSSRTKLEDALTSKSASTRSLRVSSETTAMLDKQQARLSGWRGRERMYVRFPVHCSSLLLKHPTAVCHETGIHHPTRKPEHHQPTHSGRFCVARERRRILLRSRPQAWIVPPHLQCLPARSFRRVWGRKGGAQSPQRTIPFGSYASPAERQ